MKRIIALLLALTLIICCFASCNKNNDNNSNGNNQGNQQPMDGNDDNDPLTHTIYFKNNEGWDSVLVYIWSTVNGEAKYVTETWPGNEMTDIGDGWYSYNFEVEDTTDLGVIFNDRTNQTGNLFFDSARPWWANGFAYATQAEAGESTTQRITLYFKNTEGWATPSVHAWSSAGDVTKWPGEKMKKVAGSNVWYTCELEVTSFDDLGYLFCDGVSDSGNQTSDVKYNPAKIYFSNGNSYATLEEADLDTTKYSHLYIRGDHNTWGTNDRLILDSDGNSFITIRLSEGNEFKICDVDWNSAIDYTNSTIQSYGFFESGTTNNNIRAKETGTYTFTIYANGSINVTKK